jgi:hypothetical protein
MTEQETMTKLHRLYSDGCKMPIRQCKKCGFTKGFYFENSSIRYDPGCYCKSPLPETKPLPEELLRQFIRHSYKVQAWINHREKEFAERAKLESQRAKIESEREKLVTKMMIQPRKPKRSKPKREDRRQSNLFDFRDEVEGGLTNA